MGRVTVRQVAAGRRLRRDRLARLRGSAQVVRSCASGCSASIEEHGYRPSHFGRALAERRHGALGLVFPGLSGPYFSELIQGFEPRRSRPATACSSSAPTSAPTPTRRSSTWPAGSTGWRSTAAPSPTALLELAGRCRVVVMAGEDRPGVRRGAGRQQRHRACAHPPPAGRPRLPAAGLRRHPRRLARRQRAAGRRSWPPTAAPVARRRPSRCASALQQSDGVIAAGQLLAGGPPRSGGLRQRRDRARPADRRAGRGSGCPTTWPSPASTTCPWPRWSRPT